MKIMFVNSFYAPDLHGGAERTLKDIADGMTGRGHTAIVACLTGDRRARVDNVDGVRVYRVPNKNIFLKTGQERRGAIGRAIWQVLDVYNARMLRQLHEIALKERPDIMCFHNLAGWSTSVWRVAKDLGVCTAQVLHDYYLVCPPSTMFFKGAACDRQCNKCQVFRGRVLKQEEMWPDVIVGVSRAVLERVTQTGLFKGASTAVIHNSMDIIADARESAAGAREVVFGYIGSLSPPKGLDWLLAEWSRIAIGGSLLIAGQGAPKYDGHLRSIASANVSFVGQTDAASFFSRIDVLVVPSVWHEPLGRVAIEAAAYGVPVVASTMGGIKEVVIDGVTGLMADPERPDTLGAAMEKLASDHFLRRAMSSAAPVEARRFFQRSAMVDAYEALFIRHLEARG